MKSEISTSEHTIQIRWDFFAVLICQEQKYLVFQLLIVPEIGQVGGPNSLANKKCYFLLSFIICLVCNQTDNMLACDFPPSCISFVYE